MRRLGFLASFLTVAQVNAWRYHIESQKRVGRKILTKDGKFIAFDEQPNMSNMEAPLVADFNRSMDAGSALPSLLEEHAVVHDKVRDADAVVNLINASLTDSRLSREPLSPAYKEGQDIGIGSCKYTLGKTLGVGGFATVFQATNLSSGKDVALKIINRWQPVMENEVANQLAIDNAHVVKAYEHVVLDDGNHALVFELAPDGRLLDEVLGAPGGHLSEAAARSNFRQLLEGVKACHAADVSHRDLKLDNVVRKGETWKITDFGLSAHMTESAEAKESIAAGYKTKLLSAHVGTPQYVAPEILASEHYQGTEVDVWSLGVVLYGMLNGYFPFHGDTNEQLYRKIGEKPPSTHRDHISRNAQSLMKRMLTKDPEARITVPGIEAHPWLNASSRQGGIWARSVAYVLAVTSVVMRS